VRVSRLKKMEKNIDIDKKERIILIGLERESLKQIISEANSERIEKSEEKLEKNDQFF